MDGIKKAISMLRNGKAAGPDNMPAEVLKADAATSTAILYNRLGKIWQQEEISEEWKDCTETLPKKVT